MTRVTFFKKNNYIVGFNASGHSGYSEENSDIVCSAVSTATQMTIVGIRDVLKLEINCKREEKNALLACKLPSSLKEEEIKKAQMFFKTLEISLKDIEEEFGRYLKVEVKDEIN